ncbi:Protein kinase domain-containing protein [Psidium guajava]|nr:Protein kinase domain-containing protein [Psidium guajava]
MHLHRCYIAVRNLNSNLRSSRPQNEGCVPYTHISLRATTFCREHGERSRWAMGRLIFAVALVPSSAMRRRWWGAEFHDGVGVQV